MQAIRNSQKKAMVQNRVQVIILVVLAVVACLNVA